MVVEDRESNIFRGHEFVTRPDGERMLVVYCTKEQATYHKHMIQKSVKSKYEV